MICEKSKVIFIHIPKTGGTSIEMMLGGKKLTFKEGAHLTIYDHRKKIDTSEYFCFSFVRHPYTRIQSYYRYLVRLRPAVSKMSFKDWVFDMQGETPKLFWPQNKYVDKSVKIFKFENFNESIAEISNTINKPMDHTIILNRGLSVEANLDEDIKGKIFETYNEDFVEFGYAK